MLSLLSVAIAAAPATLTGVLIDDLTGDPIAGAEIELKVDGRVVSTGATDVSGRFEIRTLEGTYDIVIRHEEYGIHLDRERLGANEVGRIKIRMKPPPGLTMTVVDERLGPEVHKTVLSADELRAVPGTFGDPVRALQALPGVARPNIAEGALVVRGAEGLNTAYTVDGMPVPYMFHSLVGRSVLPPGFIDEIEFYPGGMPSAYGEVTQATVNVVTDAYPVGRTRAHVGVDFLDGSASFEHRLNEDLVVRAAGRYSWMHALIWGGSLIAVKRRDGESYEAGYFSPKYADLFGDVRWQATDQDEVSVLLLASRDRLVLREGRYDADGDGEPDDPEWEDWDLPYDPEEYIDKQFVRVRLRWTHEDDLRAHSTWIAYGQETDQNLLGAALLSRQGPYLGKTAGTSLLVRRDERWTFSDDAALVHGVSLTLRPVIAYDFSGVWADPEAEVPETRDDQSSAATWLEPQFSRGAWYLAPGIRGSAYAWNGKTSLQPEPRLSLRRDVGEDWLGKAAIGRYTQMPPVERYAQGIGNPDLPIMTAWQASVGAEGPLINGLSFDGSIYGAVMDDLVVRNLVSEVYTEDGIAYSTLRPEFLHVRGYSVGLEGLIRMQPEQAPWWGWVAFTVGRAIRVDDELGAFAGDYDQPLSLTVLGAVDLRRSWSASARMQATSGQPHTPLYGVYVPDSAWFTDYRGEINSERYPAYFRIDVGLEKTWTTRRIDWVGKLDVYNVTWRKNAFLALYDYDYSELVPLAHLPILPTLGVEARF